MATQPAEIADGCVAGTRAHSSAPADGITFTPWAECIGPAFLRAWSELEGTASEPNPFYAPWSLPPALKLFDRGGAVQIVQFWQGGRLCGIMPLFQSASYYGYPIPHCRAWLHDNAFCGAPLVACGCEEQFWDALFAKIGNGVSPGFFFHVEHLDADGELFRALERNVISRHRVAAIVHRENRAMLRSDLTSEDYFTASMSGKKRKELRRQHKRLAELGTLSFERSAGTNNVSDWTDSFLALEAAGWKGREQSALASSPHTEALFREMLKGAAAVGKLERLALYLDGKPIAMLVNFLTPPGAFSFKTTFDETYARFSPGVLLQRENLDILDIVSIEWTDSCAAAEHPMIERIWREKRCMARVSIGIGGKLRQTAFRQLLRAESGSEMIGKI